ncbi:IS3 family transposase [Caballeronia concitans]|uniref:Transposase n=1 Tax=Caballeronia concitans TaxID=1777133 RepID=A0A658QUQ2_9BURK|nr:IS3 family transposase [Caballeronia concitans]KIG07593.1 transposase IS3/IS911 family protein [Burkholderia sp. MR1]SAL23486.1 transposase [Caballeronia concitans]
MAKRNTRFDASFKREVARMVRDQRLSVSEVCRSMNLVEAAVRRWVAQYDGKPARDPGENESFTEEQQRIRQLEAENRQLREDNVLLKRASAILARELE